MLFLCCFARRFIHFQPLGPPADAPQTNDTTFPPYLIPDSRWADEWRQSNPEGWKALQDPIALVERNDVKAIRYLGSINASKLLDEHDGTAAQWKPIHEAARQGHVEVLRYLIEELGADPNERCRVTATPTPLALARKLQGEDSAASKYLEGVGGHDGKSTPTEEL